jgi:hypothetical protein
MDVQKTQTDTNDQVALVLGRMQIAAISAQVRSTALSEALAKSQARCEDLEAKIRELSKDTPA